MRIEQMKRVLLTFGVLALIVVQSSLLQAQEQVGTSHFYALATAGGTWGGANRWTFQNWDQARMKPGVGISLGLAYGPVLQIKGLLIIPSAEIAFGEERASLTIESGTLESGVQRMPVMIWAKLISDGDLSPFLRFGAGMAKTDFREDISAVGGPTIRFHQWQFSYGLGAGLAFRSSPAVTLELFVDQWISEEEILDVNSYGEIDGIGGRMVLSFFGVRGIFTLD